MIWELKSMGLFPKIVAVILTLDEEPVIEACLTWHKPYFDYLLVLDGESKDGTAAIVKRRVNKFIHRARTGTLAEERNYAWGQAPDHDWAIFVDADERFSKSFLINIRAILGDKRLDGKKAFRFPRVNMGCDASDYPDWQTRLLRNDKSLVWGRPVHDIPCLRDDPEERPLPKELCWSMFEYPIYHLAPRPETFRPWRAKGETQVAG